MMKIPIETKPAIWGAVIGAVAVTTAGFTAFGWTTASAAEKMAQRRVNDAVVVALAPVCVERFQHAGGASEALVELKKIDTWSQGDFIEKGGWAGVTTSPFSDRVAAVAKACASLLVPA